MAFHPPRFFLGLVCGDSEAVVGRFPRVGSIFSEGEKHEEMNLPSHQEGVLSFHYFSLVFFSSWVAYVNSLLYNGFGMNVYLRVMMRLLERNYTPLFICTKTKIKLKGG